MRSRPVPAPAAWLLVALLAWGCDAGGLPSSPPRTPTPTESPAVAPTPAPTLAQTVGPTVDPAPEPPAATLATPAGPPAPGALGSYTWDGGGSDAPWIVAGPDAAVRGSGPYRVTFAPATAVATWTAAWAPVVAGQPGARAGFERGEGGPVLFRGPATDGDWTLQVDVRFAGGRHCAWYWRVRTGG